MLLVSLLRFLPDFLGSSLQMTLVDVFALLHLLIKLHHLLLNFTQLFLLTFKDIKSDEVDDLLTYRLCFGTFVAFFSDLVQAFNVFLEASQLRGALRLLFLSLPLSVDGLQLAMPLFLVLRKRLLILLVYEANLLALLCQLIIVVLVVSLGLLGVFFTLLFCLALLFQASLERLLLLDLCILLRLGHLLSFLALIGQLGKLTIQTALGVKVLTQRHINAHVRHHVVDGLLSSVRGCQHRIFLCGKYIKVSRNFRSLLTVVDGENVLQLCNHTRPDTVLEHIDAVAPLLSHVLDAHLGDVFGYALLLEIVLADNG